METFADLPIVLLPDDFQSTLDQNPFMANTDSWNSENPPIKNRKVYGNAEWRQNAAPVIRSLIRTQILF